MDNSGGLNIFGPCPPHAILPNHWHQKSKKNEDREEHECRDLAFLQSRVKESPWLIPSLAKFMNWVINETSRGERPKSWGVIE